MRDQTEWRCPWCGCWMSGAHPECTEAINDQYHNNRALRLALGKLLEKNLTYVDGEIRIQTEGNVEAVKAIADIRELARHAG